MSPVKAEGPARKRGGRERPAELGDRAKAFVREYCICLDIEEAQKRVGYHPHHGNGRRILDDPRAAVEIRRNQRKAADLAQLHQAWILSNLKKIAGVNVYGIMQFNEAGKFTGVDLSKLTEEQAYAISEIGFDSDGRPRIKFHDKIAANKILKEHIEPAKPQRVRLEGQNGGPVQVIDGLAARLNAARKRKASAQG
ncbi:terminase small subunit [Bradyrhizobium sp. PMVTL-01]|uniref:terminase small subunit n=1 Tax=Bradyrhizobium sp. PMVTL-01 TaxID=3434999 RepID=UPI003F713EA2